MGTGVGGTTVGLGGTSGVGVGGTVGRAVGVGGTSDVGVKVGRFVFTGKACVVGSAAGTSPDEHPTSVASETRSPKATNPPRIRFPAAFLSQ